MTDPALIERITRSLAFMLRHQPETFDLELDPHGYADIDEVVRALNERLGEPVEEEDVREAVSSGDRPRYEIQGERIRALYGHSIPVEPGPSTKPPEFLFVAVPEQELERARRFGLRGGRRRFLHLALTKDDAAESGRRTSRDYTVLMIHALDAWEEGISFYDRVALWLAEEVPTHLIDVEGSYHDGTDPEPRRFESAREHGGHDRERGFERHGATIAMATIARAAAAEGAAGADATVIMAATIAVASSAPVRSRAATRRPARASPSRPRGAARAGSAPAASTATAAAAAAASMAATAHERDPRHARSDSPQFAQERSSERGARPEQRRGGRSDQPAGDRMQSERRFEERPRERRDGPERRDFGRDARREEPLEPRHERSPQRSSPAPAPAARSSSGGFGAGLDSEEERRERRERPAPPAPNRPPQRAEPPPAKNDGPGFGAGL
jgi:putative RNA 2'-phosphotransferase